MIRMSGKGAELEAKQTNSERERYEFLVALLAAAPGQGVPLKMVMAGLRTPLGGSVNLWTYVPQGEYDRAPTKVEGGKEHHFVCSADGCEEVVILGWIPKHPLCGKHFIADKESEAESSLRQENAMKDETGSHYCPSCTILHTPTSEEAAKAEYIGRSPQCPSCKGWVLEPLARDGGFQPFGG
jgi:hypothetical protein